MAEIGIPKVHITTVDTYSYKQSGPLAAAQPSKPMDARMQYYAEGPMQSLQFCNPASHVI